MVQSPTAEELAALLEALTVATRQGEEATHRNAALLLVGGKAIEGSLADGLTFTLTRR